MQPNSQLPLRPGLLHEAYGGVVGYMNLFVRYQAKDDIPDTLAQFIELCTLCTTLDLVQEKPFLVIAACCYLAQVSIHDIDSDPHPMLDPYTIPGYESLLNIIVEACGVSKGKTKYDGGWTNKAVDAIYKRHNASNQPKNNSESSTFFVHSRGDDNNV